MNHNPHFNSVSEAQNRRLTASHMTDEQFLMALDKMPPERAYKLAQQALSNAMSRSMKEAHQRPVVAE